MLVHFNTYCHSCREEVQKVNSIVQKYKSLRVIGIAIGNDKEEVAEFKKNFNPEYDLVPDPQKQIYTKYFVRTVPLIDIIDRTGTIRYRGKLPAEAELAPLLEKAIAEKEVAVGIALWSRPPDFTLGNSEGKSFHLYSSIGKNTILLGFFSVRSEQEKKVIEILKTVYSRYKREDLDIIRIAVGDSLEEAKNFRKKYYVNYPVYVDENREVANRYGVTSLPKVFIINKKGLIRYMQNQFSLDNLNAVLAKVTSYFREELPDNLLMDYVRRTAPGAKKFEKIAVGDNQTVYVGVAENGEKIFVREVFKDVFCDVCTNVHFVYSFDQSGKIKNIVLVESIDLYGVPISADEYLQRVIQKADQKLPLKLKKDVDALTGATQSCKLILEGLNETPQILSAFKAHQKTGDKVIE
jgi:peroxiredoxin